MLLDDVVVAVRRLEKRLLEIEAGNVAGLRQLEQKIESLQTEWAAFKKAQEAPPAPKNPAYPDIPSLIPAQVPRVFRQKTKEGGEFIVA